VLNLVEPLEARVAEELATVGVALGIAGAMYLTRFLQRLLFGVTPVDWATFSAVAAILAANSGLAAQAIDSPGRRPVAGGAVEGSAHAPWKDCDLGHIKGRARQSAPR